MPHSSIGHIVHLSFPQSSDATTAMTGSSCIPGDVQYALIYPEDHDVRKEIMVLL